MKPWTEETYRAHPLISGAAISPCGLYRYILTRPPLDPLLVERGPAVFIMLNPSTADAMADDPTIRRCRGFASAWGCDGLIVANVYALRSADPRALLSHPDPVGLENDRWLERLAMEHETFCCAWGAHAKPERVRRVVEIMTMRGAHLACLGLTNAGAPKHPLYLAASTQLVTFPFGGGL